MKPSCYLCDSELEKVEHTIRFGHRDEPVCEECFIKTVNRQRAKQEEAG